MYVCVENLSVFHHPAIQYQTPMSSKNALDLKDLSHPDYEYVR